MPEIDPEARLKEIENRLRAVEGRLLDAAAQHARFGLFSARIDAQIRSVKRLLDAIEAQAHGEPPELR